MSLSQSPVKSAADLVTVDLVAAVLAVVDMVEAAAVLAIVDLVARPAGKKKCDRKVAFFYVALVALRIVHFFFRRIK
jgi:hypothetical protein